MENEVNASGRVPGPGLPESLLWTFGVLLKAVCCVVAVGFFVWKTRVQHHLPDGSIWDSGYPGTEQPPRQTATIARCRETNGGLAILVMSCVAAFAVSFARSVLAG
jgi:hypothetical protein